MVSSAPTRHLQFRSRCRFISSTLRNGRSQPSSTERSDRCRSDQSQVLSGALGDERDVGIGRQVHQQLDTPTGVGAGTATCASSGRTPVTGGHTGGDPLCCCRRMSRTVSSWRSESTRRVSGIPGTVHRPSGLAS